MIFDHIGIAVDNIEEYFNNFLKAIFNFDNLSEIYVDENQKAKIAFATSKNGVRLELIEPYDDDSPVANILKNNKNRLYHICFQTKNFEESIEKMKGMKCLMVSEPKTAIAFQNRRIVFFYTPNRELIELIEI